MWTIPEVIQRLRKEQDDNHKALLLVGYLTEAERRLFRVQPSFRPKHRT